MTHLRGLPLVIVLAMVAIACLSPTSSAHAATTYPWHTGVQSSWFYVGEPAGPDNDYIANDMSAWDENWKTHFGGIDDPAKRTDAPANFPSGFTPKENPYYVALPYNDFNEAGDRRSNASSIPWWPSVPHNPDVSVCKDRWVEVRCGGRSAFAQWEDVGPMLEDDFSYVFGTSRPRNTWGLKAGIDLSPAMKDYLSSDDGPVDWRFVDAADVPQGPWASVVTGAQLPSPAPPLHVGTARFTNPVAYELKSLTISRFVVRCDQPNVHARLAVKTRSGEAVVFDGDISNAKDADYKLPAWNGKVAGKRLPSASYDWVLVLTKGSAYTTVRGKITISKIVFTLAGTAPGVSRTHSAHMIPGNVHCYISAWTTVPSDSLGVSLSGPDSYTAAIGTFGLSKAARLSKTAAVSGGKAPRRAGTYTFTVKGKQAAGYRITVIQ